MASTSHHLGNLWDSARLFFGFGSITRAMLMLSQGEPRNAAVNFDM